MTTSIHPTGVSLDFEHEFRWHKSAPDQRAWRVEGKSPGEAAWSKMAIVLLRLLTFGGKQLFEWSPEYLVWRERGNNDLFRARRENGEWIIQNQEAGETRWFDCDAKVVDLLLSCGKSTAESSGQLNSKVRNHSVRQIAA
jgi:hypothetical protein